MKRRLTCAQQQGGRGNLRSTKIKEGIVVKNEKSKQKFLVRLEIVPNVVHFIIVVFS